LEASSGVWEGVYASARARWSNVPLDPEGFRKHATRLGLGDPELIERGDDLFIVAAVLEGVPNGVARFDEVLVQAAHVAGRIDRTPAFIDEVKQELRVTLFMGTGPKLRTYLATGTLLDWLRVVAVRLALNLKRGHPPRDAEAVADAVLGDQEAQQLKRFYLEDMRWALKVGFDRLSPRERTLLRLHFIDGLNIERIGVIYGAHRATVARWLVAIRRRLFEETKAELAAKHGLDTADVRSLYRLMEADVHISMSRLLAG
jgi:RNA polymerase sigma-70 factor (ECF subfamily)